MLEIHAAHIIQEPFCEAFVRNCTATIFRAALSKMSRISDERLAQGQPGLSATHHGRGFLPLAFSLGNIVMGHQGATAAETVGVWQHREGSPGSHRGRDSWSLATS